jgi:hypothetical protein
MWGGTPYAKVFKGSKKRAARLDLGHPSLPVDLKNLMLGAMKSYIATGSGPWIAGTST